MKPLILFALLLAAGCSKEPAPAAPKKAAAKEEVKSDVKGAVKETKKSIEEAADAAAKLVEAEAREEIGALDSTEAQ